METTSAPKNFFLQLGIIATLYISTISFLSFIFDLINAAFPQNNPYSYYPEDLYSGGMRLAISSLIVIFPLFIWLSRIYRKNSISMSGENKVRKWLLFLTLFLTGAAVATDLIVLINTFLNGEDITASFILKVLAVFVVCSAIFVFYLKDISGYWNANQKKATIFGYVVSAIVALSIIGGFFYIGSPTTVRNQSQDATRQSDLSTIQWQIVDFYQQKGRLPGTLDEVKDPISGNTIPVDPNTGAAYEYQKTGALTFSLCATFATDSSSKFSSPIVPQGSLNENWNHSAGHTCFARTIDPERYPVYSKGIQNQ